jgi:hypothetical protein
MRTEQRSRLLLTLALAILGFVVACSEIPSGPPASSVAPPAGNPLRDDLIAYDGSGAEYEMDTGEAACPAILNSHVK